MIYEFRVKGKLKKTVNDYEAKDLAFRNTANFNLFMCAKQEIQREAKHILLAPWVTLNTPEYIS